VRVILRHYGLHSGSLVIDDTDNKRSKSAHTLAHLYTLRDQDSGGYVWGQSLVFLVLITPKISLPVAMAFYQPAPELSAWYQQEKTLKKQGVPKKQRPSQPPANPLYPTKQALALALLAQFKTQHPDCKVHCITADALYGTAPFVDGASVMFGGVQVISHIRSNQKVRLHKREQNVSDYFATHPGTPHPHPWRTRDRCHRRQCPVIRLCPQNQTVRRGTEIRRRRHLPLSDRVRPDLAHARYCPGPDSEVARRSVYPGLEVV
jgi:hypothetical protein